MPVQAQAAWRGCAPAGQRARKVAPPIGDPRKEEDETELRAGLVVLAQRQQERGQKSRETRLDADENHGSGEHTGHYAPGTQEAHPIGEPARIPAHHARAGKDQEYRQQQDGRRRLNEGPVPAQLEEHEVAGDEERPHGHREVIDPDVEGLALSCRSRSMASVTPSDTPVAAPMKNMMRTFTRNGCHR